MDVQPTIRTPREKPAREIYDKYLQSASWRITRNHALRRADYQCSKCSSKRDLQVHHKTYERLGREWDQDVEVVCESCHGGIHLKEMQGDDRGRLYLKLANDAINSSSQMAASIADLADVVKTRCAKLKIAYDGHQIDKALALLTGQRRIAFLKPDTSVEAPQEFPPLSRWEAARIWEELTEQGLPLEQLRNAENAEMKKQVQERRQKMRELAEREYESRCRQCKTPLDAVRLQMGEKFCSIDCADDDAAFQKHWQAARARVEAKQ